MPKMQLNLTLEHIIQLVFGACALGAVYVALEVRLSVIEQRISDDIALSEVQHTSLLRELDQMDSRMDELREHIDVVDGHIYEHVQSHLGD